MNTKFIVSCLLFVSCGEKENNPVPVPTPEPTKVVVSGYIPAAFEVEVDGVKFADTEDFYTKKLLDLTEQAKKDTSRVDITKVRFEAAIGFNDLVENMVVYVSDISKRGYSGQTRVDANGKFSLEFPADASSLYKIRSNKRVSVVVETVNGSETFCYNFSAIDKDVGFDGLSKPIIMSTFESRITAYQCIGNETTQGMKTGIIVPNITVPTINVPTIVPTATENKMNEDNTINKETNENP